MYDSRTKGLLHSYCVTLHFKHNYVFSFFNFPINCAFSNYYLFPGVIYVNHWSFCLFLDEESLHICNQHSSFYSLKYLCFDFFASYTMHVPNYFSFIVKSFSKKVIIGIGKNIYFVNVQYQPRCLYDITWNILLHKFSLSTFNV